MASVAPMEFVLLPKIKLTYGLMADTTCKLRSSLSQAGPCKRWNKVSILTLNGYQRLCHLATELELTHLRSLLYHSRTDLLTSKKKDSKWSLLLRISLIRFGEKISQPNLRIKLSFMKLSILDLLSKRNLIRY